LLDQFDLEEAEVFIANARARTTRLNYMISA